MTAPESFGLVVLFAGAPIAATLAWLGQRGEGRARAELPERDDRREQWLQSE